MAQADAGLGQESTAIRAAVPDGAHHALQQVAVWHRLRVVVVDAGQSAHVRSARRNQGAAPALASRRYAGTMGSNDRCACSVSHTVPIGTASSSERSLRSVEAMFV